MTEKFTKNFLTTNDRHRGTHVCDHMLCVCVRVCGYISVHMKRFILQINEKIYFYPSVTWI